jgi:type VI secretion system secreted protein Hcp
MPAYIKLPDIDGECEEQNHKQWIVVESVGLSVHRSITPGATGSDRRSGTTSLGDLQVFKKADSSSPNVAAASANGVHMDEVVVHLCSTINKKNVVNMEIKLSDVLVSGYSYSATGDQSPPPSESFTLNYTKIEWTYKKFDKMGEEAGNFPAMYDTEAAA